MPKHQVTTWFHQTNNRVQVEEGDQKLFNLRETRGMSLGELAQLGELIGEILADNNARVAPNPPAQYLAVTTGTGAGGGNGAPVDDGYRPQRPASPHAKIMEE